MIQNIKLGKLYKASNVLKIINDNSLLDIKLGHIIINKSKHHEYYIDKDKLLKLKETEIKILSIIKNKSIKNIAKKILENKEINKIIENVKKDNTICCIITKKDLLNLDYKNQNNSVVINLLNKEFKNNNENLKASVHKEEIQIMYKYTKEIKQKDKISPIRNDKR